VNCVDHAKGKGRCVGLLSTVTFVAILSVGSTNAHAQAAQSSIVVVDAEASGPTICFRRLDHRVASAFRRKNVNLDVNLDSFTLRPVKGARATTLLAVRSDRSLQAPATTQRGARGRSKKRIAAGAIVGSVGGFFAGGFLGAHIEGDRCNCDDPGVLGFLIGAPIGALAGGILGAKFLF
jgi:hypothetical protein